MPVVNTKGAASSQGFGEFAKTGSATYIEDVFSTWLYTGTDAAQTITNGINLSGKGGLVWIKDRTAGVDHELADTVRGNTKYIHSNTPDSQATSTTDITSFNSNGFSLGTGATLGTNYSGVSYASWTFRKQTKFFDIVTYTGTGSAQTIAHNLGSTPGFIIVKNISTYRSFGVYTQSLGPNYYLLLNDAGVGGVDDSWSSTSPTSTNFTVGTTFTNDSGSSYVAYLFASNAGGFGAAGTDNVITCGSYTGTGSAGNPVTLGFEPQWILIKNTTNSSRWIIIDNMRTLSVAGDTLWLAPNRSNAESTTNAPEVIPTATGFQFGSVSAPYLVDYNSSGDTYVYVAIRRGPMKTPTDATSVLGITTHAGTSPAYVSSFPPDLALRKQITGGDNYLHTRLQGAKTLYTNYNFSEDSDSNVTWAYQNGMFTSTGANANQYGWLMRRAPSFMDVVCYTGTGVIGNTLTHNLAAIPQLMIVKGRNNSQNWAVYTANTGNTAALYLNKTDAVYTGDINYWNNTSPTSTQFTVGLYTLVNGSGVNYVAYLFATLAGVSKVGSYTGTGTLTTINCGFTGGARFVLIKRTDSTGNWYVWDTARGMVSGTDPSVSLNTAYAESPANSVYTATTGFQLLASPGEDVNTNAATYIFLAIA